MEPRGWMRSPGQELMRLPTEHPHRTSSAAESSDDDDDDIPANRLPSVSPLKPLAHNSTSLPVNGVKRSLSDTTRGGIVLYPGSKKPRNGYNMVSVSRESPPRSTSDSSHTPVPNHFRTSSLSSEHDVREGLVRSMNDALRHLQARKSQDDDKQQAARIERPSDLQILHKTELEEALEDSDWSLDIPPLELSVLPLLTDAKNGVGEAAMPAEATPIEGDHSEIQVPSRADAAVRQSSDLWKMPSSPDPQPTKKRGRPRKNYPRLRDETDKEYFTRIARLRKKPIPSFPALDHTLPQSLPVLVGDTSETLSESIEGFDSDSGSHKDVDQSFEDSFEYDVETFRARQIIDIGDNEIFDNPTDDDILAVHLNHQPLKQLCELLGDKAWAGLKRGWQGRPFHYEHAETKPARAILPLLIKLERLYQAVPSAPKLKEQNQFLREHGDMLRYYFYKIKVVVEHIRTERLGAPEGNLETENTDSRKRERMTRDLVLYVLPMLVHVLASIWRLGGKLWTKASFTGTAIELLKRALGWIMILYHRLLNEFERSPFGERPEYRVEQEAWLRGEDEREAIGPVLNDLYEILSAAPDQLAETEARIKEESNRRQQLFTREKQLEIERKAAEEARQASVAERKKQSLLSIRAIHCHGENSTASSRPSPPLTLKSSEWSVEEQRLLFLRIQASFPVCPDLNNLRWELNKTVAQTVAMTEQILRRMLKKVLLGYSAEERAAEVRRIMHKSGVVRL
ncbi:hypothetical protein F5B22DRAFT_212159 [Xylaria bambusicola]|uniref:uncharacterized protein n=1 Tax=Xylaria bambusicola TaxID=326684 RepID=UPI002008A3A8|nr:uncharacterized protein F5B22DRAFT_212159 [Xylaria bambusicola]KAI0514999.1 hypothetical protein F5B22DRAFT_212159 [Xylaria bambusicola]